MRRVHACGLLVNAPRGAHSHGVTNMRRLAKSPKCQHRLTRPRATHPNLGKSPKPIRYCIESTRRSVLPDRTNVNYKYAACVSDGHVSYLHD